MKKLEIVGLVSLTAILSYAAGYSKAREKFLEAYGNACAENNKLLKELDETKKEKES